MRITLENYLMGRDAIYPAELTDEVKANAETTISKVNSLLAAMEAEGVPMEPHPQTLSLVSSGWRPPQINAQVKNAAVRSKHMTGEAVDLYDPDGAIDQFCIENQASLSAVGLWLEHPLATKNWSHLQSVAPRSGARVFYP